MNRKQRRARDKTILKSKKKKTDVEQKLSLFGLLPDDCFICHKGFDKTNKEMVSTWNVIVREEEKSVKVYCPMCWDRAKNILNDFGVSTDERKS